MKRNTLFGWLAGIAAALGSIIYRPREDRKDSKKHEATKGTLDPVKQAPRNSETDVRKTMEITMEKKTPWDKRLNRLLAENAAEVEKERGKERQQALPKNSTMEKKTPWEERLNRAEREKAGAKEREQALPTKSKSTMVKKTAWEERLNRAETERTAAKRR